MTCRRVREGRLEQICWWVAGGGICILDRIARMEGRGERSGYAVEKWLPDQEGCMRDSRP